MCHPLFPQHADSSFCALHILGTDATIASHIATIQNRSYVVKDESGRFIPTKLGRQLLCCVSELAACISCILIVVC